LTETSGKPQRLAPLPTHPPESAGLCALGGRLYRFRVADESAIGFSSSAILKARWFRHFCFMAACVGHFGAPGSLSLVC